MKIVFMGTPAAAAASLRRLIDAGHEIVGVYSQPDRPAGRGNKIVASPVKQIALEYGLPLFQPTKIRTPEALAEYSGLDADIAVVVAYGRILPETFLGAFPRGAVNLHFSLLPKYRGAAPVNWAIVNGETRTGVTTIRMDAGLDTGDILLARETRIGSTETAPELMERLSLIGAEVMLETLENWDSMIPTAQNGDEATFAPVMKREDGLIDWSLTAIEIVNRIRGFQPFPGTYSYLNERKASIWGAYTYPIDPSSDPAGTILSADRNGIVVMAGSGSALKINEVQIEGKRRMTAAELLNGFRVTPGDRFVSDMLSIRATNN